MYNEFVQLYKSIVLIQNFEHKRSVVKRVERIWKETFGKRCPSYRHSFRLGVFCTARPFDNISDSNT